jgi:hypothetical protein
MTIQEILTAVSSKQLTAEAGAAMLAAMAPKAVPMKRRASIKVGAKKNVVVKLGSQMRYPTTLYANQWIELAEVMPDILKFIEANKGSLSMRTDEDSEAA